MDPSEFFEHDERGCTVLCMSRARFGCQIRKKALIILDRQDLLSQIPGTCSRFPRAVEDIRDVGVIMTRNRGHDIVPS